MCAAAITKLTSAGQISLPREIRKKLNLSAGDFLEIEVTDDGRLILSPRVLIPKEEAFFHRADWRKAEQEADADIAAGRVSGPFANVDDLFDDLTSKDRS